MAGMTETDITEDPPVPAAGADAVVAEEVKEAAEAEVVADLEAAAEAEVVAEVEDETTEWTIDQAHEHAGDAVLGDLVEYQELEPTHFGRVGAQVAGQVVRQRLREAERETIFDEFAHREGEIITGSVGRVEPAGVILDLGKAEAILRSTDQSATEHYRIGQHVKAYVLEVRRTTRGPLIYVSRTHKNFLRRLFELPGSTWADYDRGALSAGGMVVERTACGERDELCAVADPEDREPPGPGGLEEGAVGGGGGI